MSFLILLLLGVCGGALGGMGMGGGTLLIPLLTLAGVPQKLAQALNLLSFLPMSAAALAVHAKNGLLKKDALLPLALPAALFSALFALLAAFLPARALRTGFAVFLLFLSLARIRSFLRGGEKGRAAQKK